MSKRYLRSRQVHRLYRNLCAVGFDARQAIRAAREIVPAARQARQYSAQEKSSLGPRFPAGPKMLCFGDSLESGGTARGHYFHQDLVVARDIYTRNPRRHIDVGSSVYGFVSHVASFRQIEVLDIRSIEDKIPGITFRQADIMNLPDVSDLTADSVSCLHALEHMGLGRYGDPIAYDGWQTALTTLTRMVEVGGVLYISVPTGQIQRTEFNAHRVFRVQTFLDAIPEDFHVTWAHFVHDDGSITYDFDPRSIDGQEAFGSAYGLSIWALERRIPGSPSSERR